MTNGKVAAISPDSLQGRPLHEISAADFLTALAHGGQDAVAFFRGWPEKKKYELLIEPEFDKGITFGRVIGHIREKKKLELEKNITAEIVHKPVGTENIFEDPRQWVVNPAEIAREVVRQMKGA